MPVLAVSGLDHDIKVFTPSADQPTDLDGIHEVCVWEGERRWVIIVSRARPNPKWERVWNFVKLILLITYNN